MKVKCPICGIMCFDGCKDEEKEMAQHMERKHGIENYLDIVQRLKKSRVYIED